MQLIIFKKYLIFSSLILLVIAGCSKSHNQSAKIENSDFPKAGWITDNRVWPVADSLMYGDFPAPLFRKEFKVKKELKSAVLYILPLDITVQQLMENQSG
jgi:alpha-L-rhamnosidase